MVVPHTAFADVLSDALSNAKPLFSARLRYETVDQENLAKDANSVTFRLRAGLETGPIADTVFGVEFDWIESIVGDFNSLTNGRTEFPIVRDPQDVEVNRLYLQNTSLDETTITLGRQRIEYDDARFIGDAYWRQNQQTFDALSVTNASLENFTVNIAYVNQVNRLFGPDSALSPWDASSVFLNAAYQTPFGTLTGFAYLLDLEDSLINSTQTIGFRFAGAQKLGEIKVNYAGSYARQSDYQDNPVDYAADYYAANLTAHYAGFRLIAGYDVLGSDGGLKGVSTPLAKVHKHNGFADLFVITPNTGVRDLHFKAGYTAKDIGPFSAITGLIAYHNFDADFGGANYGDEVDVVLTAKWKKFLFLIKYAEYNAASFGPDTRRLTFDLNFNY